MRTVIAEYESAGAAERALHTLEERIPIQSLVIAPSRSHQHAATSVVVSMIGTPQSIRDAQSILRAQAAQDKGG